MADAAPTNDQKQSHFIREIIERDLEQGTHDGRVITRFPPEPNGYLHIGHAKSICLNFGLAEDYDGTCHLRFDDTNPLTESEEYAESIIEAVRWLGYDWGDHLYYASDYFEHLYDYAIKLIRDGHAYVDSLSEEEIRQYRGTVTEPGKESPHRSRSADENLDLFERMRAGEFEEGEHVLRAKIDMASPHMILRDPLLYRIMHAEHYRTGDEWCIYPMYDFAHPLEDAIENITHSLCTLEFDNNRRVYDWVLEHCLEEDELPQRPHQYEFNRLNLDYTIVSKRKLLRLVEEGVVSGWDDPRLPTLAGLRRRGVPPQAIRTFCQNVGVTRSEGRVQLSHFEHAVRDTLNYEAPRFMAVIDPLKVEITNFRAEDSEVLQAGLWPRDIRDKEAYREIPFGRNLLIDRADFQEEPEPGFIRLAPGREVRLRHGYFITCKEVVRDEQGNITELRCTYDPETRDGTAPDGRSPESTIHWLPEEDAIPATFRQYDRLFTVPEPGAYDDFTQHVNPESLVVRKGLVESAIRDYRQDVRVQFEREGYYWRDPEDSTDEQLVFNQIVALRDTWAGEDTLDADELAALRAEKAEAKERQRERSTRHQRDPVETLSHEAKERYAEYRDRLGLDRDDAAIIADRDDVARFFEQALEAESRPRAIANWIVNELLRELKTADPADLRVRPAQLAKLAALQEDGEVSSRGARLVFEKMVENGGDPVEIVEREGLRQIEDRQQLEETVARVVESNPDEARRYRSGKKGLIGFFMGHVMQETGGRANPPLVREMLERELEE